MDDRPEAFFIPNLLNQKTDKSDVGKNYNNNNLKKLSGR